MGTWFRRLAWLLRQSRHDADLREEIEAHRALRASHLERDGLTPQEAAEASRRALGNTLLAREEASEIRLGSWGSWGTWWQDVRYGLRTFRRNPTFTAAAMVTIALGIGVNAGIVSVLNGVLFRDLSVPDAHELVSISQTVEGGEIYARAGAGTFSTSEYRVYRDRAQTLSGLLAHGNPRTTTLGGDAPQEVSGTDVSCNYFTVLRQPPALGRALAPQDCEAGAAPVVVIGHQLWRTAFAADPGIVGRAIELNRQPFTVVGVAAEATYGGSGMTTGYFAPFSAEPILRPNESRYENDQYLWLYLIGRRNERAGLDRVRAELDVVAARIDGQQPGRSTTLAIGRATPMTVPREFRGVALAAAAVLMAAFGSILLLACANVANLLLARGTARSQEIGVRLSLGASRARVVRQLLTESLLIAGAGGLLGSVLALWSFQTLAALALQALVPPGPRVSLVWDLSPDVRVLAFTVALTAATGVLFGLMPALYASRPDLLTVIKPDAPGATGRRRGRLRGTLVGVQVALCMTLMIAAGLLLRGLYATYTTDVRFVHRDVATVSLTQQGGYDPAELVVLQQRLMDRVQALPGVDAVAGATLAPLGTDEFFTVPLRLPEQSETEPLQTRMNGVTPGYFSLLGIPVVRGRAFTEADIANPDVAAGTRPAIVSETTARHLWPEGDPIGRIALWGDTTLRVVGVAADAQVTTLGAVDPYYVYVPVRQGPMLLVKSRAGFGATAAGIRNALQAIDPMLVPSVRPLEANLEWWRGVSSMLATLGTGLGVLALVLASVGIYGVVSYSVTRRHREIGVRMALGATAQHVLGMVLRQTMRPVVVGAVIGVAGASALSRVLSAVLFGVSPADPVGLGGAALLVLGVALAAGVMAAWPAARIDPAVTLRCE